MAFVPAREQLLDRLLGARDASTAVRRRALVIGAGYSPLARALRERGFETTSIDPSEEATAIARLDAPGERISTAPATALSTERDFYDLVYCADTLEVGDDLDAMIGAAAAAARPGATIVFDTVTNTLVARLIYLVAFQRLPFTRIMSPGRYTSSRLRNPSELTEACERANLTNETILGFEPKSILSLVSALLKRRTGRIADEALPAAAGFHLSPEGHAPVVTYFAVATKKA